jgi:type VI secretion system protein ImpF
MSRFDNEVRVQPSVLDRLIDYEPEISREAVASRSKNLRLLKQSVRRDLEWLLNTRKTPDISPDLTLVNASAVGFGIPDFTNLSARNPADHTRLRRSIEQSIEAFEPRLEGVVVTIDQVSSMNRTIHFRIDARLKVDPAPEPVVFDTTFHVGSGEVRVKGD